MRTSKEEESGRKGERQERDQEGVGKVREQQNEWRKREDKCHYYCHYSVALPSHLHNLLTQFLLHQNSHTSRTITIPRPTQLTVYLLPSTPINRTPCSLHLPFCRQHTSIPLFLSSSHTSVLHLALILPTFQVPTLTPSCSSGFPSFCKQCLHGPGSGAAPFCFW